MNRHALRSSIAVAPLLLSLAACTLGPDFLKPAPPSVKGYLPTTLPAATASANNPAGQAQRFVEAEDIPGQWWTLFQSPALNSLVQQALAHNPSLDAASAALRAAQETALAQGGALLPQVGISAGGTRERLSGIASGQPKFNALLTVWQVGANVSYNTDVFGGAKRQLESAEAQAEAARYQLEASYLTLTANVVAAAVTEAALRGQIAATQEIIGTESQQLEVLNKQFELGGVSKTAVLAESATLAQTRATLPGLNKQLGQERDLITALTGAFSADEPHEQVQLADLHLPTTLPVSIPSKLVEQRPDIQAAAANMHAASALIGVATAAQYPQLNLTGSLASDALTIGTLFEPAGTVYTLGASVSESIFNGGALAHRKEAAVAQYQQAEAQYRSTVLNAFQSVADALRALQADADALAAQVEAVRVSDESLQLSHDQFQAGAIPYTSLLDAQRTDLQTRITLTQAEAARFADTAALFQALGGGWWNRDDMNAKAPPAPPPEKSPFTNPFK